MISQAMDSRQYDNVNEHHLYAFISACMHGHYLIASYLADFNNFSIVELNYLFDNN